MIEITNLTKRYGNHLAVDNLSLTIENGQVYGFLGPNGAGKSTTMNMMTGTLAPTSGTVKVDGYDIFENPIEAKRKIGYLPEIPPVYPDMTPCEYLKFVGMAKGLKGEALIKQTEKALKITDTEQVKDRLIKTLSKGFKQRVGIAQAIMGEPEVIILDEPTVGLDPKQIIEIRELISQLGKEHTVILSSHIMQEISAVCSRIMIISKGKLIAFDTPENLEQSFAGKESVVLTVKSEKDEVVRAFSSLTDDIVYEAMGESARVTLTAKDENDISESIFELASKGGIKVLSMERQKKSLEDIFLEATEETAGAEAKEPSPKKSGFFKKKEEEK